ncbi:MAG: hypothetical protein GY793_05570 [Proteobacteria bacterium]|nr:hypothetical protein [Pseudomonadota bacterium]
MNKKTQKKLDDLWRNPEQVNVIYFSFESFADSGNIAPPKITSIAVKNLHTSKTDTFQSTSELEMLNSFFYFTKDHKNHKWVGWNIDDENFGLHALELRYKFLKGEPYIISEKNKYDLSKIITTLFRKNYSKREAYINLKSEMNLNTISSNFFKTEQQETELFAKGEFKALQQSALLKVNIFASICEQAFDETKNIKQSFWGSQGQGSNKIVNWLIKHPMFTFFLLVMPAINHILDFFKWIFSKLR